MRPFSILRSMQTALAIAMIGQALSGCGSASEATDNDASRTTAGVSNASPTSGSHDSSPHASGGAVSSADLVGYWHAVSVVSADGQSISPPKGWDGQLRFLVTGGGTSEVVRLFARLGCNDLTSESLNISDDRLNLDQPSQTAAGCYPEAQPLEDALSRLYLSTPKIRVEGNRLTVSGSGSAVHERAPA